MRIVLTVVGLSLIDDVLEKELVKLAKHSQVNALPDVRPDDLRDDLRRFKLSIGGLKQTTGTPTEDHARYDVLCQEYSAVAHLAEIQHALWRSPLDVTVKRAYSPAELASLSLLDPPLGQGDQVWLLYSETALGALCSAVLSEALRDPGDGSALCGPGVHVIQQMLEGVQIDDPGRLTGKGLLSWALTIERALRVAPHTDDKVLLNITGGYKGLAPLGTLLAFGLSESGRSIEVFYLYEESEQLLSLPGSDLLRFDLSVFERFAGDWERLPTEGLPWPDEQGVLTSAFVNQVVNRRPDLVAVRDERLELTVTGRLLLAVWRARQEAIG